MFVFLGLTYCEPVAMHKHTKAIAVNTVYDVVDHSIVCACPPQW